MAHDPFVHQLEFSIAARPRDVPRVLDFIIGLEKRDLITDCLDNAARVPTDDTWWILNHTIFAPA